MRTVINAPIEAAAIRDCLFRAKPIPAASRIAPARYPHTLGNGTQDGVIYFQGNAGRKLRMKKMLHGKKDRSHRNDDAPK